MKDMDPTISHQQWKFTKLFAQMWHKAIWKGHQMRLELTRVGLLVELANHYTTRGAFQPPAMGGMIPLQFGLVWFGFMATSTIVGYFIPNPFLYIKLATLVEGDLNALFSIATTPRCRGERYSIPWIAPLYSWSLPYNVESYTRQHQVPFFESLVWLDLGLNPGHPDHWRTLYSWGQ